ncbi:hypothetical protein I4U23_003709 [Adineta vaga]|nr:hypothetical protein I4U23_003709 [Adineta vaga]
MFRCGQKCISKHRLVDYRRDCMDNSDEAFNGSCSINNNHHRTICTIAKKNITQCIETPLHPESTISHGKQVGGCLKPRGLIHFPTLCDGFVENEYRTFDGTIETDESNCDQWLCDNQYTRCDGTWNCLNGIDEADCANALFSLCKADEHPCLSPYKAELFCLSINQSGNGIIDCLGATDERHICRKLDSQYHCWNHTDENILLNSTITDLKQEKCIDLDELCDGKIDCPIHGDDEMGSLCQENRYRDDYCMNFASGLGHLGILIESTLLCQLEESIKLASSKLSNTLAYFTLSNYSVRPPLETKTFLSRKLMHSTFVKEHDSNLINERQANILLEDNCHGGVPIYMLRNGSVEASNNNLYIRCLCPPSLYGPQCQYQNQRLSVILQIGALNRRNPFIFIIFLLDDDSEQVIHSYHRISYVSIRDCATKFIFNLLYNARPKNINRNSFIRIDVFETIGLIYRASWKYPIKFPFLPVYTLAIKLTIPPQRISSFIRCSLKCGVHGQCGIYMNTNDFFCHCKAGWWGQFCTNPYKCHCSSDSLCVGFTSLNNRSICVCPLEKFGLRCYLSNRVCQLKDVKKCRNDGLCIPRDRRILIDQDTICLCPESYYGDRCEKNQTRLAISFVSFSSIPAHIHLHFISVPPRRSPHERATTFVKVPLADTSVSIYWSTPFNIIFAQIDDNIYRLLVQPDHVLLPIYSLSIKSSQRCPLVREVLDETTASFPPIVKFYHVPCQKQPELECFHDNELYICLCTHDRRANCLTFNFQMEYNSIVILALPRLIFAFVLECMKSARDSVSLFVVGYFISFIPPLLTFTVFILPSKTYMKEFKVAIRSIQKIKMRLCQ